MMPASESTTPKNSSSATAPARTSGPGPTITARPTSPAATVIGPVTSCSSKCVSDTVTRSAAPNG
jgi:hypothetical protein